MNTDSITRFPPAMRPRKPAHGAAASACLKPLALALALAFAADESLAATPTMRPDGSILWPVDNCNDAGAGSLRDTAFHAQHGDAIDLSGLSCSTISVTSGAITLHDVALIGPGADRLEIDGTGNDNHRIFNRTSAGGDLDIGGVTINGGKYLSNNGLGGGCLRSAGGSLNIHDSVFKNCMVVSPTGGGGYARGGAIASYGDGLVTLTDTTISANTAKTDHAQAQGGGVYAVGSIDMVRTTISNNTASGIGSTSDGFGGGVFTRGFLSLEDSTIDGNVAAKSYGGAAAQQCGMLVRSTVSNNIATSGPSGIGFFGIGGAMTTVDSSTISGNRTEFGNVEGQSGGLYTNCSVVTITNSTITANTETNAFSQKFGAGLRLGPGVSNIAIFGTIVAGNYYDDGKPPFADDDISGTPPLAISGDTMLVGWTHLVVPADTIFDYPRLGPLQDNGGPTKTHMPLPGSPVIDAGDAHQAETDQRGFARVVGAAADIGAVELADDAIFFDGFE